MGILRIARRSCSLKRQAQLARNAVRDFILNCKHVFQLPVIALRPYRVADRRSTSLAVVRNPSLAHGAGCLPAHGRRWSWHPTSVGVTGLSR